MILEDKDQLKVWLTEKLPKLSDADPEYLSKYIITLVAKSNSEGKLKKTCKDALKIFLSENTEEFVNNLIKFLRNLAPLQLEMIKNEKDTVKNKSPNCKNKVSTDKTKSPVASDDSEYWHNKSPNIHVSKRHRDSSNHKEDLFRKKKKYDENEQTSRNRHVSRQKQHRSRERIDNQNLGRNQYNSMNNKLSSSIVKTSCTDFVEKGFCLKGDSCEFDHGSRIVLPDLKCIYSGVNMGQNSLTTTWMNINSSANENQMNPYVKSESNDCDSAKCNRNSSFYDPSHPEMNDEEIGENSESSDNDPVYVPTIVNSTSKEPSSWWDEIKESADDFEDDYKNDANGNDITNDSTINHNSNFTKYNNSGNRYQNSQRNFQNNYNKRCNNTNCLLVTNIPIEQNDEATLRSHFEQFGFIKDIIVDFQNDQHNSLIEFETIEYARAAYKSPHAILDNRFIKTTLFNRNNNNSNGSFRRGNRQNNQYNNSNNNSRVFREALERNIIHDNEEGYNKWNRKRKLSNNSDDGDLNESSRYVKTDRMLPIKIPTNPNDFKFDRRSQNNEEVNLDKQNKLKIRLLAAQKLRKEQIKQNEEKAEKQEDMKRMEKSLEVQKKRLKTLLEQSKSEGEDKDLISRQLNEAYLYYQELQQIYDSILRKVGLSGTTRKIQLIKEKTEELKEHINLQDKDSNEYKNLLKQMTALKREQVKLESEAKNVPTCNPQKLPKAVEMKLDNRPKVLYLTEFAASVNIKVIKHLFKTYKISKFEESLDSNSNQFIGIHFLTRKECDKAISELSGILIENKLKFSFDRPSDDSETFDFSIAQNKQRGNSVKNENCLSSDDEETGPKPK